MKRYAADMLDGKNIKADLIFLNPLKNYQCRWINGEIFT